MGRSEIVYDPPRESIACSFTEQGGTKCGGQREWAGPRSADIIQETNEEVIKSVHVQSRCFFSFNIFDPSLVGSTALEGGPYIGIHFFLYTDFVSCNAEFIFKLQGCVCVYALGFSISKILMSTTRKFHSAPHLCTSHSPQGKPPIFDHQVGGHLCVLTGGFHHTQVPCHRSFSKVP